MADVNGFHWFARQLAELQEAHDAEARQTVAVEDCKRLARQIADTLKVIDDRINEIEGDMQNGSINAAKIEALVTAHVEYEQWMQAIAENNSRMEHATKLLLGCQKQVVARSKELAEAAKAEAKWRMGQTDPVRGAEQPTW